MTAAKASRMGRILLLALVFCFSGWSLQVVAQPEHKSHAEQTQLPEQAKLEHPRGPMEHVGPAYAPGELIVSFTEEAMQAIEQARTEGTLPVVGLESLDALFVKYGVNAIEPLFPGAPSPKEIEAKFPERAKRAPPEAKPFDMRGVYKLTLNPEVDLLQIAFEFLADPSIEYAQPNFIAKVEQDVDRDKEEGTRP